MTIIYSTYCSRIEAVSHNKRVHENTIVCYIWHINVFHSICQNLSERQVVESPNRWTKVVFEVIVISISVINQTAIDTKDASNIDPILFFMATCVTLQFRRVSVVLNLNLNFFLHLHQFFSVFADSKLDSKTELEIKAELSVRFSTIQPLQKVTGHRTWHFCEVHVIIFIRESFHIFPT